MQCPSCDSNVNQLRQCTICDKVVCRGNNDISCYQDCLSTCHNISGQVDNDDFDDDGIYGRFTLYQPPNVINLISPPQSPVVVAAAAASKSPADPESPVVVGEKTLDQILKEKEEEAGVIDVTSPPKKRTRRNPKNDKDGSSGAANVGGRKSKRRRRKRRKSKKRKSKKFRKSRKSRKRIRTRKKRRRRKR